MDTKCRTIRRLPARPRLGNKDTLPFICGASRGAEELHVCSGRPAEAPRPIRRGSAGPWPSRRLRARPRARPRGARGRPAGPAASARPSRRPPPAAVSPSPARASPAAPGRAPGRPAAGPPLARRARRAVWCGRPRPSAPRHAPRAPRGALPGRGVVRQPATGAPRAGPEHRGQQCAPPARARPAALRERLGPRAGHAHAVGPKLGREGGHGPGQAVSEQGTEI